MTPTIEECFEQGMVVQEAADAMGLTPNVLRCRARRRGLKFHLNKGLGYEKPAVRRVPVTYLKAGSGIDGTALVSVAQEPWL